MVVVIDADREVAEMLVAILCGEGYQAHACPAMYTNADHIAELQPDMAIVDLHFACPQATLSLLHQLRRNIATAHLPLVVTSTSQQVLQQHATQLDELGCATLCKPFLLEQLFDQLDYARARS
jgi:DNA-binding response OmpR family regulator